MFPRTQLRSALFLLSPQVFPFEGIIKYIIYKSSPFSLLRTTYGERTCWVSSCLLRRRSMTIIWLKFRMKCNKFIHKFFSYFHGKYQMSYAHCVVLKTFTTRAQIVFFYSQQYCLVSCSACTEQSHLLDWASLFVHSFWYWLNLLGIRPEKFLFLISSQWNQHSLPRFTQVLNIATGPIRLWYGRDVYDLYAAYNTKIISIKNNVWTLMSIQKALDTRPQHELTNVIVYLVVD